VRDVDVGIIAVKPLTLEELNEIASKLEEALGVNVDVVPLDEAPPLLRFKALTEGVRVVNRNPLRLHYMISEAFMELMDLGIASGSTTEGLQVTLHCLKTKPLPLAGGHHQIPPLQEALRPSTRWSVKGIARCQHTSLSSLTCPAILSTSTASRTSLRLSSFCLTSSSLANLAFKGGVGCTTLER
jgi:hypothetical protein